MCGKGNFLQIRSQMSFSHFYISVIPYPIGAKFNTFDCGNRNGRFSPWFSGESLNSGGRRHSMWDFASEVDNQGTVQWHQSLSSAQWGPFDSM